MKKQERKWNSESSIFKCQPQKPEYSAAHLVPQGSGSGLSDGSGTEPVKGCGILSVQNNLKKLKIS
ncbi:MAG: hypothetical protein NC489_25470 [Ruminococcus flavefaciens]|nr:hypothetical protein [Ruminococcus flavefaciens]